MRQCRPVHGGVEAEEEARKAHSMQASASCQAGLVRWASHHPIPKCLRRACSTSGLRLGGSSKEMNMHAGHGLCLAAPGGECATGPALRDHGDTQVIFNSTHPSII